MEILRLLGAMVFLGLVGYWWFIVIDDPYLWPAYILIWAVTLTYHLKALQTLRDWFLTPHKGDVVTCELYDEKGDVCKNRASFGIGFVRRNDNGVEHPFDGEFLHCCREHKPNLYGAWNQKILEVVEHQDLHLKEVFPLHFYNPHEFSRD